MNPILELARPDILSLQPYQHAAWEPSLERMHANEMPWRASGDDAPSPVSTLSRAAAGRTDCSISRDLYGVAPDNVLAGRGSDEGIDLLVRAFCRAGQDSVLICPPTFGMYKVSARIQGAGVVEVPLLKERGFALDARSSARRMAQPASSSCSCARRTIRPATCSIARAIELAVRAAARHAHRRRRRGLHRVRARGEPRSIGWIAIANLVVLRTLSKAYALAGARCGALLAHADIVSLLARVITPYALPTQTIEAVLTFTDAQHRAESQQRIDVILSERARLSEQLARLPLIRRVWPSDANFLLVDCIDADRVLRAATSVGLIIRDPRSQPALGNSLRISVGTPEQNDRLLRGIAQAAGAAA